MTGRMSVLSIITAKEAAGLIDDADTLIVGGNGGTGAAEAVLDALEQRFLGGAGPHGLTLINITGVGAVTEKGLCHLAHEGMIARVVGGNFGLQVPFMRLVRD
jgi:propionate CoA-transferase